MSDTAIAVAGTIIGSIVGGTIAYLGTIDITRRQRISDAGRRLRMEFHNELVVLQSPGYKGNTNELLRRNFHKHAIAISEFKCILPKRKRTEFAKAWEEYHCTDCGKGQFRHDFAQYEGLPSERDKNTKLAIERINNLFAFAEEKGCIRKVLDKICPST